MTHHLLACSNPTQLSWSWHLSKVLRKSMIGLYKCVGWGMILSTACLGFMSSNISLDTKIWPGLFGDETRKSLRLCVLCSSIPYNLHDMHRFQAILICWWLFRGSTMFRSGISGINNAKTDLVCEGSFFHDIYVKIKLLHSHSNILKNINKKRFFVVVMIIPCKNNSCLLKKRINSIIH